MSGKIIILGELSKKHLLPLFLALSFLIYLMIIRFYPDKGENHTLDLYCNAVGFFGIIVIPYIFKFTQKDIQNLPKVDEIQKNKYLHYFVLIIVFIAYIIAKEFLSFYSPTKKGEKPEYSEDAFSYIGVEMILLTIVSLFFLKYKYYRHHIISIVGFVICGNVCDYLLDYFTLIPQNGYLINSIKWIGVIVDVIFFNVQKYMMEMLYYPYWRINITLGITLFCITTIILLYIVIGDNKEIKFVSNFDEYFTLNSPLLIIGKLILSTVSYFIFTTLCILNIFYFNPNYFIINFQLSKFVLTLIDNQNSNKYYCIIFFVLQTFFLLIFLEIIELNFCGLNDNTKRNVELRGLIDITGEYGRDSSIGLSRTIDVNDDYTIDSYECDKKENIFEMTPKMYEDA